MPTTLRQVAAVCGVSTATVSRALAGQAYVRKELREQIQAEALRLGYAPNRLVGSLMAHVRRARAHRFVGNLAVVHVPSTRRPHMGPQAKTIVDSACRRARELGFAADFLELQPGARGESSLVRVLRARGVTGVLLIYPEPHDAPVRFPWEEFSVVALDLARRQPVLNTVCLDHYATMLGILTSLRAAGYRRPGLFIEHFKDARTNHKWSASFRSFQMQEGGIGHVPVLIQEEMKETAFVSWWTRYRPDVVIGHFDECVDWLGRFGRRVPGQVGFFSLNWLGRGRPCAGVDPQLELQGRVAAEMLISQVQHGERGLPAAPRLITIPGSLVAGPTARWERGRVE